MTLKENVVAQSSEKSCRRCRLFPYKMQFNAKSNQKADLKIRNIEMPHRSADSTQLDFLGEVVSEARQVK